MCICKETVTAKLNAGLPVGTKISLPTESTEFLSGRIYIDCIKRSVTPKGKPKEERVPLLLSKCPFCGEAYPASNEV
jgi:hypothetical protein